VLNKWRKIEAGHVECMV